MSTPIPDPVALWLGKLAAAHPAEVLQRLTALEAQQTTSTVALAALAGKIYNLEAALSDTTNAIAELNTETDNLSARIDAVLASIEGVDDATAAELRAVSARLKGLAADPANPVPPVDEEPAPPVDEPQA